VRRLARGEDDGFASSLVPGLKSSLEARRLAEEIAFSAHRLETLQSDPPGLYASIADPAGELEERTWLAFLVAYLGPLDADPDPFAAIRQAHVPWSSGELPRLEGVEVGPRGAHDPARGTQTVQGYRNWALRAGSQAAAFAADPSWTSERRLERVFERLALPGLHRGARFELLLTLGALGVYELTAGSLRLGGSDEVTVAAKRALGIGDPMLLERRAAELAAGCAVPLGALDLALFNWGRGQRSGGGVPADGPVPAELLERLNAALGL
jgi:hypothetical protein